MKIVTPFVVTLLAATTLATGAVAKSHHRHYNNGNSNSAANQRYEDCRADKRRSGHQGIAIGAIAGGAGTALLGGGVGGSLLGAAAGGTAGNFIGRGSPHRCSQGR